VTSPWPRYFWRAGIAAVLVAGCFPRVPARDQGPATWFPYIAGKDGYTDLWAVSVPGGQHRQLTDDMLTEQAPAMMADGRIVYASKEVGRWRLKVIDPRPAASDRRQSDVLPKAEFLYEGGKGDDFAPTVSPSGQVVFVSNRNGTKQIFAVMPGAREATLLTPGPGDHDSPAPGPDGRIVYVRLHNGIRQVWIMDGDGGMPKQLTNLPMAMTNLALLPASKLPPPYRLNQALLMPSAMPGQAYQQLLQSQVIFVARRTGDSRFVVAEKGPDLDIFRFDPATNRVLNLTSAGGNDMDPVVMPSGLIAFTTDRRGGVRQIWTMDGWGGNQEPWITAKPWVSTR
jgi:Tol biopolymer transport system component